MTLVAVASAKGAPGVTTLTVALGALTSGAIVADLDPDGGDLALRYGREDGAPLDPEMGLLSLAASLRRDHLEIAAPTGPVEEHLQVAAGGLDVLLGVTGPDQAVGLGPLWSPLARALAETERTVFADCGRIGPASPAMPVLMQADAVLLLARAELEELAHLRERLRFLTATLPARYAGPARIGVILVVRERDRAAAPRTEQLLRASGLAVPVLGAVADDPRGAGRLRGLHGGRPGRTTLIRSVRSLLPAVTALTGRTLTVGVLTEAARVSAVPANELSGRTTLTKPARLDLAPTGPSIPQPSRDLAQVDGPVGQDHGTLGRTTAGAAGTEPGIGAGIGAGVAAGTARSGAERNGGALNGTDMTRAARLGRGRKRAANPDELTQARDAAAAARPAPANEPVVRAEPVDPADPVGSLDPADSVGSVSSIEPVERAAADPLPRPEPAFGPDPDTDVWLGTRAAEPAPAPSPVAQHSVAPSPYRHARPTEPPPAVDQTNDQAGDQSDGETVDQATDHDSAPSPAQPSENGWPRPGRGTPSGGTATVLQNWGR